MTPAPTLPGAPRTQAPTPLPAVTARLVLRSPARPCDGRLPGSAPLPAAGRMACRALRSAAQASHSRPGGLARPTEARRMTDVRPRVPVAGSRPCAPWVPLRDVGVGVGCPVPQSAVAGSDGRPGGLASVWVGSRAAGVRARSGRVRVGGRILGVPLALLRGLGVGVGCRALGSTVQGLTVVPGWPWGKAAAVPSAPVVSLRGPAVGAAGLALGSDGAGFGGSVASGEERVV